MSLYRKFYFLGFAIFVFSYFLPAVPVLGQTLKGYESALWILGALLEYQGLPQYAFVVFANLGTVMTVVVFALQFRISLRKLVALQATALVSALFWAIYDLVRAQDLSELFIGYWNWLFGIALMLVAMIASARAQRRPGRAPEPQSSPRGS